MMRLDLLAPGLAVAFLVVTAATPPASVAPPATGFAVYHFGSLVEGNAFREEFLVHAVMGDEPIAITDVVLLRDGEPLDVTWQDSDGFVTVEDRLWFVQEAFDEKQILTATRGGEQVMECRFGGGAGVSIHPDEWRAMGLPQEVRCLQFDDDQLAHH